MWKLNRSGLSVLFSVLFVLLFCTGVSADVIKPQLDIQTLMGDGGISSDGFTLGMDATAIAIITDGAPIDITDVDFSLKAQFDSFDGGIAYNFKSGSLTVGSLLTADFSSLVLRDLGELGEVAEPFIGQFEADLSFTGGSLMGNLSGGRIVGIFSSANPIDYSSNFTATTIIAKVGPIVPIPGVIWLLGSGLIAYVGIRKRKMFGK